MLYSSQGNFYSNFTFKINFNHFWNYNKPPQIQFYSKCFNPLKIINVFTFSLCRPQSKASLINSELLFDHLNMSLIQEEAATLFFRFRPTLVCSLKTAQAYTSQQHTFSVCLPAPSSINSQKNLRHIIWVHTLITGE